jgi:hypothetical protein
MAAMTAHAATTRASAASLTAGAECLLVHAGGQPQSPLRFVGGGCP